MSAPRILIACIGNIFLGDDAFGVEVAREMLQLSPMEGVTVIDFGIRGMDLMYALSDNYDATILVDAVPRGGAPGTLYVIEPDPAQVAAAREMPSAPLDSHGMDPEKVLRTVLALGGGLRQMLLVGCEPTPFDPETEMDMSLSPPVRAAIPEAVAMIGIWWKKFSTKPCRPVKMSPITVRKEPNMSNRLSALDRGQSSASLPAVGHDIIYRVGIVGVALIVLFLLGALPMIPDFFRYMKIKSM